MPSNCGARGFSCGRKSASGQLTVCGQASATTSFGIPTSRLWVQNHAKGYPNLYPPIWPIWTGPQDHNRPTRHRHHAGTSTSRGPASARLGRRWRDTISGSEKRSENTSVAELGRRYLDEYAIPHKKPSGIAQDRRNLQNHVMPLIGKLQVKSIKRADIAKSCATLPSARLQRTKKRKCKADA